MTFGPGGPGKPWSPWKSNKIFYLYRTEVTQDKKVSVDLCLSDKPVRIQVDDHTFAPTLPGRPGAPSFPTGPWKYKDMFSPIR